MRVLQVVAKIRMWCKGLLDVFTLSMLPESERPRVVEDDSVGPPVFNLNFEEMDHMSTEFGDFTDFQDWTYYEESSEEVRSFRKAEQFSMIKFAHRSISDILTSILPEKAREYRLQDGDVSKALLRMLIVESSTSFNSTNIYRAVNLAYFVRHTLRVLRLRRLATSSPLHFLLEELEIVRFRAWQKHHDHPAASFLVPGAQQSLVFTWDTRKDSRMKPEFEEHRTDIKVDGSATVLSAACVAGLYEYIRWKFDRNDTILSNPKVMLVILASITGRIDNPDHNNYREFTKGRVMIQRQVLSNATHLVLGSSIPGHEIKRGSEGGYLVACHALLESEDTEGFGESTGDPAAKWTWLSDLHRILGVIGHKSLEGFMDDPHSRAAMWECLEVWLEFGAYPPEQISYLWRGGVIYRVHMHWGNNEKVAVRQLRTYYRDDLQNENYSWLPSSPDSMTFSELVKHHNPPNADVLVKLINRNLARIPSRNSITQGPPAQK